MIAVDVPGALQLIDAAVQGIDEYHAAYGAAEDSQYGDYEVVHQIEQTVVVPRLELARQIAQHIGFDQESIVRPADYAFYNRRPFETNRSALVVMRTRLSEQERMATILGLSGLNCRRQAFTRRSGTLLHTCSTASTTARRFRRRVRLLRATYRRLPVRR
jgi:hypothetical protein